MIQTYFHTILSYQTEILILLGKTLVYGSFTVLVKYKTLHNRLRQKNIISYIC
jgi:hypothetical protein